MSSEFLSHLRDILDGLEFSHKKKTAHGALGAKCILVCEMNGARTMKLWGFEDCHGDFNHFRREDFSKLAEIIINVFPSEKERHPLLNFFITYLISAKLCSRNIEVKDVLYHPIMKKWSYEEKMEYLEDVHIMGAKVVNGKDYGFVHEDLKTDFFTDRAVRARMYEKNDWNMRNPYKIDDWSLLRLLRNYTKHPLAGEPETELRDFFFLNYVETNLIDHVVERYYCTLGRL